MAIEHLTSAYLAARRLGARPLARAAAEELARLGEKVERRLDRRAAGKLDHAGLSRREVEVLRLISLGRTNREIAQALCGPPFSQVTVERQGEGMRSRTSFQRCQQASLCHALRPDLTNVEEVHRLGVSPSCRLT